MIKGSFQQEEIIVNKYAPDHVKKTLKIKGEMNHDTIVVGNFNTPFSS